MKTLFPGFREEDDDEIIRSLIKAENLTEKWESLDHSSTDRIFIYPTHRKELWIIQEFTGVKGDEGLLLYVIDEEVVDDPRTHAILLALAEHRGINLKAVVTMAPHFSPRNKN